MAGLKPSTHVLAVPEQESVASHAPSCELPVQGVVAGAKASAGQEPDVPVQLSATSHWPAEARHSVVAGLKPSTHVLAVPEQESVASHAPSCELPVQGVVAGAKPFAGQVTVVPVQLSATSHWPAEARQMVVDGFLASAGQSLVFPSQLSATSQSPADSLQMVVDGFLTSVGQLPLPSQLSATSHWPLEARQRVVAGRGA